MNVLSSRAKAEMETAETSDTEVVESSKNTGEVEVESKEIEKDAET